MKQSVLDQIGGETILRKLVDEFYDLIETMPEGAKIKKMHDRGHGLEHVRLEQFNFLSGFLGGRRYYEEKFGHMNVKLMHEHVPISMEEAENWLTCMNTAFANVGLAGPEVEKLRSVLRRVALLLVNDPGSGGFASNQGSSST